MKHNKYLFIIILAFSTTHSCKKSFLDVEDTSNLFRQSYVKDLNSMNEFMNGVYVALSTHLEFGYAQAYPELVADNLKTFSATSSTLKPHYYWQQKADELDQQLSVGALPGATSMNPLWATGYRIIRACNFVIEDINKYRNENTIKADDIKGQAFAMRALIYFKLVNTFAQTYKFVADASHPGVPYITSSDISEPYSRQTVAEVYSGIIADFTNAIQLLPASVIDTRLMNRNAAKALLAEVYLFKEDFTNAKILAAEVATQVPLMTITAGYPNDIFKFKAPSQTESLFQLSPRSSGYTTNFLNRYLRRSPIQFVATNDVANILAENPADVRKNWIKDTIVAGSPLRLIKKFPSSAAPEVNPAVTPIEIAYYPTIIRSSEMFLIVAEASAKTGDEATARTYLDSLRKRSNLSITPVSAVGNALLDSIYKERRKELCFEGLRMFDLQRWKLGVHRIDAVIGAPKDLPYPSNQAIAPIPPADVKLAGIAQNQGY